MANLNPQGRLGELLIPRTKVSFLQALSWGKCRVCHKDPQPGEWWVMIPCGHLFHQKCIDQHIPEATYGSNGTPSKCSVCGEGSLEIEEKLVVEAPLSHEKEHIEKLNKLRRDAEEAERNFREQRNKTKRAEEAAQKERSKAKRAEAETKETRKNSCQKGSQLEKEVMDTLDKELIAAWYASDRAKAFRQLKKNYHPEAAMFRKNGGVVFKSIAKVLSRKVNTCASAETKSEFDTALNNKDYYAKR